MLRDNLVGLIEPMFSSAGANPLALCIARQESSDDRPPCLENPRPEGAESTLTENALSPFHAEPKQDDYARCQVVHWKFLVGTDSDPNHLNRLILELGFKSGRPGVR